MLHQLHISQEMNINPKDRTIFCLKFTLLAQETSEK